MVLTFEYVTWEVGAGIVEISERGHGTVVTTTLEVVMGAVEVEHGMVQTETMVVTVKGCLLVI